MKKLFALALVVFGLAACQTDHSDLDVQFDGNATITLSIPADAVTRTGGSDSALSGLDNTTDETIRFILAVYDETGEEKEQLRNTKYAEEGTLTANFPVRLVPGRKYTFVAWADMVDGVDAGDKHYNTSNLKNITLNGNWNAMDETRDAFTANLVVEEYAGSSNLEMTLKRPFAKLRVIATDVADLARLDLTAEKATVTYSGEIATSYNAFEQKVAGTEERAVFTFDIAEYGDSKDGKQVLYTDYIFANKDQDAIKFSLTTCEESGREIKTVNFNTDIPVKRNMLTTLTGNVMTEGDNVTVTIDEEFGGAHSYVEEVAYAQSELDNAIANTTIYLKPGVNYGTLYIRPVAGAANTTTDCDYLVYRNEMLRTVENLTIVGAEGATVDAIKVEAGYVKDSGSTGYVVDIKNLVIDSVVFNDTYTNAPHSYAAPIFFDLTYTNVDGLTVKNCKLEGNNDKMNFVYFYGSGNPDNSTFETAAKNIVIDNNTIDGIARLCELRQAENVTITNNTIKNTALHGILLPVDNGTYSGNVTITNNVAEGINERFVRMAGAGDAVVVIKDNTIIDYKGADPDIIKVTDGNGTNVTIENNSVLTKVAEGVAVDVDENYYITADAGLTWVADQVDNGDTFAGKVVKLTEDITLPEKNWNPIGDNRTDTAFSGTFDGQNHTISGAKITGDSCFNGAVYGSKEGWGLFSVLNGATVKNVKLDDEVFASYTVISGAVAGYAHDTTFENIDITNTKIAGYNWYTGGVVGWASGNCTFKGINLDDTVYVGTLWDSHGQNAGGIAGGVSGEGTYIIEDCNIACVMDVINDVTSNYKWWIYRVSGMIIGNTNTTETKYNEVVTATATNVTCNNVTVTYGDWMNYHYCEGYWNRGWGRYESSDYVGGVDQNEPHNHADGESHYVYIPFDQLFGGSSNGSGHYPVKGLAEFPGVTVNYPASYRREVSSAVALTEALGKGVSVVLGSDIDFGSTQLAITGKNQVVDLGGHALTTANNYGGISLKNGATIKNGTITHAGNTAAIKAFNGSSVENVTINATCSTADKTVTGIAVQQGANVESIKNVTINGVSQGIEVGYQATVGLIENAVVNESNNGTAKGIALVINGGKVGLAKDCTFNGETYGITMHLKGVFNVGLELQNCIVEGTTASIYAWDEKGVSNTSGSLNLTYDAATTLTGPFVWDFEEECQSVVTLNRPE